MTFVVHEGAEFTCEVDTKCGSTLTFMKSTLADQWVANTAPLRVDKGIIRYPYSFVVMSEWRRSWTTHKDCAHVMIRKWP